MCTTCTGSTRVLPVQVVHVYYRTGVHGLLYHVYMVYCTGSTMVYCTGVHGLLIQVYTVYCTGSTRVLPVQVVHCLLYTCTRSIVQVYTVYCTGLDGLLYTCTR